MMNIITKSYPAPPFVRSEILRYSGTREATTEINAILDECLKEAENVFTYKVCYGIFPLSINSDEVDLSFTKVASKSLSKWLENAHSYILFAATIGIEIDRLISKYSRISPSKALMFQAIGTERIESLCDEFCRNMKKEFGNITPRFSPGYGDLSIEIQKEIFAILDPYRKIGSTLNESLVMSPSKSVTAIVGISECEEREVHNCSKCNKKNCLFRR